MCHTHAKIDTIFDRGCYLLFSGHKSGDFLSRFSSQQSRSDIFSFLYFRINLISILNFSIQLSKSNPIKRDIKF